MSATLRDSTGRPAPARDDVFPSDDLGLRDAVPTVARGHNVVTVLPPDPVYGGPLLAGLTDRLGATAPPGQALILCPAAGLTAWGALLRSVTGGGPLRVAVAPAPGRVVRRLREATADLVVTTPDTALGLLRRSALALDRLAAVVLVWPEAWDDHDELTPLMQDLPRDTQRLVLTSDPAQAATLAERYAHKALTVGLLPGNAPPPPVGPVRIAVLGGRDRRAALAEVLELLDPSDAVIWAASPAAAAEVTAAVAGDVSIRVVTGDAPTAALVVAYDVPSPARLAQLVRSGEVVLLAQPTALPYLERVAHPRRPLRLPGLAEQVSHQAAAHRATLARLLEDRTAARGLFALAPLFERYEPTAVAAALYELWTAEAGEAPVVPPEVPAVARVFVAVGRKDGATANDLVATLIKEVGLAREKIGRIELKDTFCLIEVPAREAEAVAAGLNGRTIRRRRVTARVDQGPGRKRTP